ncbi:MAG: bifunctional riboflavin kinase/FAD synthetase [Prevotella sp.]|nr:bifunctional riboflavin kinase/FAD synthetase [Prevotella sp.]
MTTIRLTSGTELGGHYAATIGFFDGVHLGHRYLVEQLMEQACRRHLLSMVITFDRHPRQVIQSEWQPRLLSSLDEKQQLLSATGIDQLVILHFDSCMASLSAHDFMQQVLKRQLAVELLLTGYDNHFGHREPGRQEGFDDYVQYGREMGMDVVCGQPLIIDGLSVSSSLIRRLLCQGRVEKAATCLGHSYQLNGIVVHGEQMGRQMGFPTANMEVGHLSECSGYAPLIPANGVYAVWVEVEGNRLRGMTNIGHRPTFEGQQQTIETHIFDFHADLYGQPISIAFVARLRDEQHFDTVSELASQMQKDKERVKKILA